MYSYFCLSGRHVIDGVEVMRYRISLPEFTGLERISQFYREISERVVAFCEGELKAYAEGEYGKADAKTRKFRYPAIAYRLDGSVTYEGEAVIFVRIEATLKRHGDTALMRRAYDAHAWSPTDECLIPSRQAAGIVAPDKKLARRIKSSQSVLYSDGRIFVCDRDSITELSQ